MKRLDCNECTGDMHDPRCCTCSRNLETEVKRRKEAAND